MQTRSPLRTPGEQEQQPHVALQPSLQSGGALQPTVAQLDPASVPWRRETGRCTQPSATRTETEKIVTAVPIAGLCGCGLGGSGGSQAPSVRTFGTFLRKLRPGLTKTKRGMAVFIGFLLFAGNFSLACFGCAFSQESFALARPGNITMDNAFSQTYQMIGTACGRTAVSLLLGNGVLAVTWKYWIFSFSNFQTIFLLCSGGALFCLIMIFCIPSVAPAREDHYCP